MVRKHIGKNYPDNGDNNLSELHFRSSYFFSPPFTLIFLMLIAGSSFPAYSGNPRYSDLPVIALLALTPNQHAVLMQTDRQLLTLTIGDALGNSQAHIVEILSDRIVLQQSALAADDPPRLIWLYPAAAPDQPSRRVTLDQLPPPRPVTVQPAVIAPPFSPAAASRE